MSMGFQDPRAEARGAVKTISDIPSTHELLMRREAVIRILERDIAERDAEIDRLNAVRREAQARVAELTTELQKMRVHLHRNTAAAMNDPATRWYCLNKIGVATLCADQADAVAAALDADIAFPRGAPHRAVQMVELRHLCAVEQQRNELTLAVYEWLERTEWVKGA